MRGQCFFRKMTLSGLFVPEGKMPQKLSPSTHLGISGYMCETSCTEFETVRQIDSSCDSIPVYNYNPDWIR